MPDFDVVELGPAENPEAGDEAPDFTRPLVNAEFWEDLALSDLTERGSGTLPLPPDGRRVPRDLRLERDPRARLDRRDQRRWASISSPYEHKQPLKDRGVDARLFSDPQNGVAEEYGIVNDLDGMAGIEEPRPAAFVIDGDRTIQYAWVAAEWPDFPDYDEIEAAIDDV